MINREYIKNSILLCSTSNGQLFKRTFFIVKKLDDGEGASCVCYEAYHENSGKGILKEFYPKDGYSLERTSNSQLILSNEFGAAKESFLKKEREYIKPYEMLLNAKQKNEYQELNTFIPAFEIYYGCDENGKIIGTTYIWSPEPELETFSTICNEIHKNPNDEPERKLITVLTAIESLVKCLCLLHAAGFVHRDIKPSNFGFIKRGNDTLTQNISLFDINSIISVYQHCDDVVTSMGYSEPEAFSIEADNQTDIYSVGATLFHALIDTDETKANNYLYKDGYFEEIHKMIDSSRLIKASEANSHHRLRNILSTILKKCLGNRNSRYENCDELLEDIESALFYALPAEIAKKNQSGEKWILTDIEKSLDIHKDKNSFLSMQYHLFENPLYECCSNDEREINILLLGFGNYGQKFMDACLQTGQMIDKTLNVFVYNDDNVDKEIYLDERPALREYFNIDGAFSLNNQVNSYGNIYFRNAVFNRKKYSDNLEVIQEILSSNSQNGGYHIHYAFIALGEDSLNLSTAKALKKETNNCIINYISENSGIPHSQNRLRPVPINIDVSKNSAYDSIERMAFNTHLVWEKNLNIDYKKVKDDFRKKYNHDSCVSSVLALKYKLHSFGIELTENNTNEVANKFEKAINDYPLIIDQLIWIEHRRWVAEKLCLGWSQITNLEYCISGGTKNERNKQHVCIIRSESNQNLHLELQKNPNFMDTASQKDLKKLDDLDRMSVDLHRMYAKKAADLRKEGNILTGPLLSSIRDQIEENKESIIAFQEWMVCLKDVWNGERGKVYLYKGLKEAFIDSIKNLPSSKRISISNQIKAFDRNFYPILASMEYRDWKQDDTAFINNIPFILTYTEDTYLAIPYKTGDIGTIFSNVASATVINPKNILYLYSISNDQDTKELKESIPYLVQYMRRKHFNANVGFLLVDNSKKRNKNDDLSIVKEIRTLGDGKIRFVEILLSIDDSSKLIIDFLKKRSRGKSFFALEKNDTEISKSLQKYNLFSSYRYDSYHMCFYDLLNCEILKYIRKNPYITIADIISTNLISSSQNSPEFYADYEILWEKYNENRTDWRLLCNKLKTQAEKNDILVSFNPQKKTRRINEYSYILPYDCIKNIKKILNGLVERNVIESKSHVVGFSSDSCFVKIYGYYDLYTEFNQLFSNIYILMNDENIVIESDDSNGTIHVIVNNLHVSGFIPNKNEKKSILNLLLFFQSKGYIINLSMDSKDLLSFMYSTKTIKDLLTHEDKIVEIYTYHKTKEIGPVFDDMASNFITDFDDLLGQVKISCVLTKGFRTLFVVCKSIEDKTNHDFFSSLSKLVKKIGINATLVFIDDTAETNKIYTNSNKLIFVNKLEEINNIGTTLQKIINKK